MKFIITESKMDSLIDSFISKELLGLKHKRVPNPKALYNRDVWYDDNDNEVIIILTLKKEYKDSKSRIAFGNSEVYLADDFYGYIFNLFSMKTWEEIQSHLLKWFEKHMNIKTDEIMTFDSNSYIY